MMNFFFLFVSIFWQDFKNSYKYLLVVQKGVKTSHYPKSNKGTGFVTLLLPSHQVQVMIG